MEIVPGPEWDELLERLIRQKGTAVLLGATDSGKSTLARHLIEKLLLRHIRVSFVDSDVGQSSLGLPGTISMKIFSKHRDIGDFKHERMFFIGSLNPSKKIPMMIECTKRMVDVSRGEGIETIIVDTTGLIDGEVGKALKVGKIRAINPEHLIAIQRHDELEHILSVIKGVEIYRITASRMAKRRSREARIRYREERFREYFRDCWAIKLSLKKVECFYNRRPFDIGKADFKSGTLTGINHDEDTIALGIIEGIEGDNVLITTPLKSSSSINRIVFGEITLTGQVL